MLKYLPLLVLVGALGAPSLVLADTHWAAVDQANEPAENSVFAGFSIEASSEPVPVSDMISGWDGPFQPGEYAYGDGRIFFGVESQGWTLKREQRWYYYLEFSEQTSRTFNALERGEEVGSGRVDLEAWSFESYGFSLAKTFYPVEGLVIEPEVSVYRIGHYQFGTLKGFTESGTNENDLKASAILDYHFDDDKILDFDGDQEKGRGISLNTRLAYSFNQRWAAELLLLDLWNQQTFEQALFTDGCIEFGNPSNPLCDAIGVGSGRSGVDSFNSSIPVTLDSAVHYQPWNTQLSYFQHGRYRRLGATKTWPLGEQRLSLSGYSDKQLGIGWQSRWHRLELSADDAQAARIRDVRASLTLRFPW